jgi:serine/threonine protein phosphatase PrpC
MADTLTKAGRVNVFETARVSETGGRPNNEDFCTFLPIEEATCWVVADGLGAHKGGELASRTAAETICQAFRTKPEVSSIALAAHIDAAQEAILDLQQKSGILDMRTTVVVLLADSRAAIWAHVGDSRLYRFQPRGLVAQTEDHSVPMSLVKAGEISAAQIRGHADRNRLLRTLGERGAARPAVLPGPVPLAAGDAFLLCTDGFWENVLELEMAADLAASGSPEQWLDRSLFRLRKRIHQQSDNYSALAVFYAPAEGSAIPRPAAVPGGVQTPPGKAPGKAWSAPRNWFRRRPRNPAPAAQSAPAESITEVRKTL